MQTCLANSESLFDVTRPRHMWSIFRRLPHNGSEVMCHKDLTPANILVQGDKITGLLDGGSFGPADPALDLVAAWAFQQAMGLGWYYEKTNPPMSYLGQNTIARLLKEFSAISKCKY